MRKHHWIEIDPANFTAYFLCLSLTVMLTLGGSQVKSVLDQKHQRHADEVHAWNIILNVAYEAEDWEFDAGLFLECYQTGMFPISSFNGHVERDTVIQIAKKNLRELLPQSLWKINRCSP